MNKYERLGDVLTLISSLLDSEITLFIREGQVFEVSDFKGSGSYKFPGVPADGVLVSILRSAGEEEVVPSEIVSSNAPGQLRPEELVMLQELTPKCFLPVLINGDLIAFLSVGGAVTREQSKAVRGLVTIFARQLLEPLSNENAYTSKMLSQELVTAREMYEGLFPKVFSDVRGIECAGESKQVFEIGGDYYDFIALPDGKFAFVIGDVSGKGITAALMMANMRASLRREMSRSTMNLAGLVGNLNHLVRETSPSNRYITLFYAQYDPVTSRLQYVNAGHPPPLLLRRRPAAQPPKHLKEGGLPIGILESIRYDQGTEILQPGDVIVAFTDGVTEALNSAEEEWGLERLTNEVSNHCDYYSASKLIPHLFEEIKTFTSGTKQYDDMSLIIIRALDS